MTKYNYNDSYGTVDYKIELYPEDDVAHAKLGGRWRIPTDGEWTELRLRCEWTLTTQNGVKGYKVTAPNGNSIFLPAAGMLAGANLSNEGSVGFYWSSSLCTDYPTSAWGVLLQSDGVARYDFGFRYLGFSVRPVTE